MIGEITTFPDDSQVWIFPSPVAISADVKSVIDKHIAPFITTWQAHGKDVLGAYWIANDYFLCIAAHSEVELPTGCAIDAMTHSVANAEKELQINLRDRSQVYFLKESGGVRMIHFSKVTENIEMGLINTNTQIFQTSINTLQDFRENWLISAQKSWIKRFFMKKVNIS